MSICFSGLKILLPSAVALAMVVCSASEGLAQCSRSSGGRTGSNTSFNPIASNSSNAFTSNVPSALAYQQQALMQRQMFAMQQQLMQQQMQLVAARQQSSQRYAEQQVTLQQELLAARQEKAQQRRDERAERIAAYKARKATEQLLDDELRSPVQLASAKTPVPALQLTSVVRPSPFAVHD